MYYTNSFNTREDGDLFPCLDHIQINGNPLGAVNYSDFNCT